MSNIYLASYRKHWSLNAFLIGFFHFHILCIVCVSFFFHIDTVCVT